MSSSCQSTHTILSSKAPCIISTSICNARRTATCRIFCGITADFMHGRWEGGLWKMDSMNWELKGAEYLAWSIDCTCCQLLKYATSYRQIRLHWWECRNCRCRRVSVAWNDPSLTWSTESKTYHIRSDRGTQSCCFVYYCPLIMNQHTGPETYNN